MIRQENAAIEISGGEIYIYCSGDGIDSNSRTSYKGIIFSGGRTVVISNSGGNSAIDSEQGYTYTGGTVIAVMPRGGMSSEATHCESFSSVGKTAQMSLTKDSYLVVNIGESIATVKMPATLNALVITLGDGAAGINTENESDAALDENGVGWN